MLATFDSRPPGLSDDEPIAAKFLPPRGMLGRLLKRFGDRRGAHGDQQWRFPADSVSCRCDQFRSSPYLARGPSGPRERPIAGASPPRLPPAGAPRPRETAGGRPAGRVGGLGVAG